MIAFWVQRPCVHHDVGGSDVSIGVLVSTRKELITETRTGGLLDTRGENVGPVGERQ